MPEIRKLDIALRELGYTTLLRSPSCNPTLLATRLPVLHTETPLLDTKPTRTRAWYRSNRAGTSTREGGRE